MSHPVGLHFAQNSHRNQSLKFSANFLRTISDLQYESCPQAILSKYFLQKCWITSLVKDPRHTYLQTADNLLNGMIRHPS